MRRGIVRTTITASVLAAGLLLAVGCGGDDDPSARVSAATPDITDIPAEPIPAELPQAFIFRGTNVQIEDSASQEFLYVVQIGDSLGIIAERFGISAEILQRINGIADPSQLRAGDELRIPVQEGTEAERIAATTDDEEESFVGPPPGEEYVIEAGDTLFDIGLQFGVPWEEIATYNRLNEFQATNLVAGDVIIIPPLEDDEDELEEPPG